MDTLSHQKSLEQRAAVTRRVVLRQLKEEWRWWKWIVGGIPLLALGLVVLPSVEAWLAPLLGEIGGPFVRTLLILSWISVGIWLLVIWFRFFEDKSRLPCPKCAANISRDRIASITGNCSTCGHAVIPNPFPGIEPETSTPSDAASLRAIGDFQHLAKRRYDRLWISCLIGGGLAFVLLKFYVFPNLPGDPSPVSAKELGKLLLIQFVVMSPIAIGFWIWQRYSSRGLRCPCCRRELLGFYRLVISSRRCYHCGCEVLKSEASEEPTAAGDSPLPPITR